VITLAPRQDLAALNAAFRDQGVVQVEDLLSAEDADRLRLCLLEHVPWGLAYYDEGPKFLRAQARAALSSADLAEIGAKVRQRAARQYQYFYESYPMLDAYLQQWGEVPLLDQATRYAPGHFLRRHDDISREGETWLVAHVLNLTPEWEPDWGGYLQLYDGRDDVWRALKPRFNVLNLMRVPQPHSVTSVAPFAAAARYAITGWFRSR